MPLATTTVNGTITLPDGGGISTAIIAFSLVRFQTVSPYVIPTANKTANIAANGDFTVELAPNDPAQAPTYLVTLTVYNSSGAQVHFEKLGYIAVPAIGPVELADLIVLDPPESTQADALAQALAAAAAAAGQALLAQGYADDAELSAIDAAGSETAASGFADDAAASAALASSYTTPYLDDVAAVLADTSIAYGAGAGDVAAGDYIRTRAEGFSYEVAAAGAVDHDIATAGGVKLYVMPTSDGAYNVSAFGAVGDGVADDAPAINQALLNGARRVFVPAGSYRCEATLRMYASTHLDMHPDATLIHAATYYCLIVNGEVGNATYATGYDGDGDLHVSGGTIDMTPKTTLSEYCEAIGFAHAENVLIENIRFRNNYNDHFIEINSTRNCTIRYCVFDTTTIATPGTREMINIDYASAPGFPPFGDYDATPCDGVLIDNCRFLDGDVAIGSHSAPTGAINRHQNITVRDCFIDTMGSAGIDNRYWNAKNSGVYRTPVLNVATATDEYRAVVSAVDGRFVCEIPDDGVALVPMPLVVAAGSPQGMVMISGESNAASTPRGLYWVRCQTGFEVVQRIATGSLDTAVDLTTGVLTGTTGTDGRVTLSAASDGYFYIENRRGAVLRLTVLPAFGTVGNVA